MKSLFIICVLFLSTSLTYAGSADSVKMADEKVILASANQQLISWLKKIPNGQEKLYGFNSRDEFTKATLGKPIWMSTIADEKGYDSLKFTGEARIPVIVDNRYKALITVSLINGNWTIVNLGATELAANIQEQEKLLKNTGSDKRVLLRLYDKNCDFIGTKGINYKFFPLPSAQKPRYIEKNHGYTIHELKDILSREPDK